MTHDNNSLISWVAVIYTMFKYNYSSYKHIQCHSSTDAHVRDNQTSKMELYIKIATSLYVLKIFTYFYMSHRALDKPSKHNRKNTTSLQLRFE